MQRLWAWLGLNLGKHAGVVSLVGLIVTLVLGFGVTRLDFATGQDSYLDKDEQVYKDNVRYQGLFGGQAMVTLYTMDEGKQVLDLFTPDNLTRLRAQEKELRGIGGVLDVVSPLTALEFTDNLVQSDSGNPADSVAGGILLGAAGRETDPAKAQIRTADGLATLQRINAVAGEHTLDNPQWVDFLLHDNQGDVRKSLLPFFPDEGHAQMVSRLTGNASLEDEGRAAEAVIDATDADMQNATVLTTGAAELLKQLNDYLRGGMLLLGAIAVAIMVLILLVLFDVRWRLLPLGVILVGVVWAFGLAGYLGIPLSVVTIAGLPVMLGVGIDYAIQMHSRIEEEVIVARADHPIQETARNLGPALLVVTFDAVFAFLALQFAKVPMIRDFGLLLAVGIAAICFCSIIMPLSILGIREYRSPTKGRDFTEGPLGRLVLWLGSLPSRIGLWLVVASVVIFAGGMAVENDLSLQTDPERWVNQDSDVIRKIDTLKSETGSSSELGIFVQSDDAFDDETVAFVDGFAREELTNRPDELLTASSVVTTVSFLLDIPGASTLAPTGDDVAAAYAVAPEDIQKATARPDDGALNLIFRTAAGSLEDTAVYVDEIRAQIDPPAGVEATPSGLAVVGVGLLHNLESNRILLTYLAIGFVGIFLAVRLKSIVRSLLSLVPVLIAVGTASLVAWVFDLQLSPMTAVGGPLVVAACTEFTSLILLRYLEERRRGLAPREAVDVTAEHTGRAFIVSACTAIAGVAVISFSSLPLLRDFGIVVAMNVTVALLSALVILPPMLVWADRRGWVSHGIAGISEGQGRELDRTGVTRG
ncbi:MAG TPA: MMPL family transporter [Acidimicrobiales bacterium]|nr:MMPL family transporter [Acidimicrobiales bacterium]